MLSLIVASALSISSPQLPMREKMTNPVWDRNFPDPFIARDGDDFYVYATQSGGPGFQVMKSANLVDWTHVGRVNAPEWANGQLWAPEVYKVDGKWYMFFSARDKESGKRDLAVSVADRPNGPFKFVAKLVTGVSENPGTDDNGAIDPTLFFEGGKSYLFYIREARPRSIKMVELAPDFTRTIGEKRVMIQVDRPVEQGILDAPTVVKKDGAYWLFYSSGWFQSNKRDAKYQVWAARSHSLAGPYIKPASTVLSGKAGETYSPGHQCLIELASGEWWMAYHAWNAEGEPRYGQNPKGRTLRIDPLLWSRAGPKCQGPSLKEQQAPKIK
jgi:beta-xylosidase